MVVGDAGFFKRLDICVYVVPVSELHFNVRFFRMDARADSGQKSAFDFEISPYFSDNAWVVSDAVSKQHFDVSSDVGIAVHAAFIES